VNALHPATAFFELGERFSVFCQTVGSNGLEARRSKIGKPRWIQNNGIQGCTRQKETEMRGCGFRQEPWEPAKKEFDAVLRRGCLLELGVLGWLPMLPGCSECVESGGAHRDKIGCIGRQN
jgi:hypothetical protein